MTANALKISSSQHIFLDVLTTPYRAFVGGFGSGKTYVGCLDQLLFARNYDTVQGYFGPSYPSIVDIYYPTIEEAAEILNMGVKIKEGKKEVHLYNRQVSCGKIICRSMDRPESISGFKIARALVDEIDTLPVTKAFRAWRKIIARMRLVIPGVMNVVGVVCTPEGFAFLYKTFKENPTKSYSMVQASTYENEENLPDDYIENLLESYPAQLVQAYIDGQFVNLTTGSVYPYFDRSKHHTNYVQKPRESLHVGMDFNVRQMAAVVHVIRKGIPYAVGELIDVLDTPTMIDTLKELYPEHKMIIYPDASGESVSSKGASLSDLKLLRAAGFSVSVPKKNPAIKDRVIAVNCKLLNGKKEVNYFINTEKCPITTLAFEQHTYTEQGVPDKSLGHDHKTEAVGYFIHRRWPAGRAIPTVIPVEDFASEIDHSV